MATGRDPLCSETTESQRHGRRPCSSRFIRIPPRYMRYIIMYYFAKRKPMQANSVNYSVPKSNDV